MIDFNKRVRGHWFVVARTASVTDRPMRAFLFGWPIVLARCADASVIALEDRCPHLGVPLSDGRMSPLGLACKYHGWTFDGTGRCTSMPSDIRVPALLTAEHEGLIWACQSERGQQTRTLETPARGSLRAIRQTKWSCDVVTALQRFFDLAHAHAVSRRGGDAILLHQEQGFDLNYPGCGIRMTFQPPGVVRVEYRGTGSRFATVSVCFTPDTLVSTSLFAGLHRHNGWLPRWWPGAALSPILTAIADDGAAGRRVDRPRLELVSSHLKEAWS